MNVVPLDAFSSDRQFEAHSRSLPRVILEGPTDVRLFVEWFEHLLDDLDFVAAEKVVGGGGCTSVEPAVEKSREVDKIPAVGIVDRDTLYRAGNWTVLFSLDDQALVAASTEDVFVTSLWEVEAYLLRPELLGAWVGVHRHPQPSSLQDRGAALGRTLEECEALLNAMPLFTSGHAVGQACDERYFSTLKHHEIGEACNLQLGAAPVERQQVADQIAQLVAAVRNSAPVEPSDRLLFLLRYVDTKRLLQRLVKRLGLHKDAHWALATLMSGSALRPAEIEAFLDRAVERFAA